MGLEQQQIFYALLSLLNVLSQETQLSEELQGQIALQMDGKLPFQRGSEMHTEGNVHNQVTFIQKKNSNWT